MSYKNITDLLGPLSHVGYVVEDLDKAMDFWVNVIGSGPFQVFEHAPTEGITYLDEPGEIDHHAAFAKFGPIFVELQQVFSITPPGLNDLFVGNGPGLNHMSYLIEPGSAAREELTALGFPPVFRATTGGLRPSWHDTRPLLGYSLELYEATDQIVAAQAAASEAAENWDGKDPVVLRVSGAYA